MRSTAQALFGSSEHTSQRAESAVQAFNEASTNVETAAVAADELSRSIAEISRQLTHTTNIVSLATAKPAPPTVKSADWLTVRRRSAM